MQPVPRADRRAARASRTWPPSWAAPQTRTTGPVRTVIDIDEKNPDAYMVRLSQSGLGMPDRDYYLLDEQETRRDARGLQEVSRRHARRRRASTTRRRAAAIYALEARIAEAHWPQPRRRDADKIYNPMSLAELERFAPQFPWERLLRRGRGPARHPKGERIVVVREKSAFPKLAAIFAETPRARVARLSDGALPAHRRRLPAEDSRRRRFRLLRHGDRRADSSSCRATARRAAARSA